MLKFQQNELIKILFVTSLTKEDETTFRMKKIHERWKLNGNIFFELFSGDLDEQMTSAGYWRRKKQKRKRDGAKSG